MSDHTDPPAVAGLRDRDITDLYAFHPPGWGATGGQDLSKMVLVLAVNPLSPAGTAQTFSDKAEYLILIDTNGDAEDDIEIELEFEELEDGVQEVEVEMEGDGFEIEGEGVTDSVIDLGGGAKLFAGLRDDPFFFDLTILDPNTPNAGTDTFAGSNVSAIVLEVPTSALTPEGSDIGVWGAIEGSDQIDRVGRPAISTVLIPSGRKNFYNASEPEDDVENFTQDIIDTLVAGFGRSAADAAGIAGVLLPDILTVDASVATAFLNGRNLDDDVIDAALKILTGNSAATDGIGANDTPFLPAFPYLWPPHGF